MRLGTNSWSTNKTKMIMLFQHAEKKETSSSMKERYERSKWSFGDAFLVTD